MPTPTKGPRLGGSPQHERLLLSNLATALFAHGGITTTQARAKRLRPLAERLVTQAKKGDLHNRRLVLATVRDRDVVYRLFDQIAPGFADRPGGYTRITKLMPRKGDNAPMARIELVEALTVAQEAVGEAERARGSRFARRRGPGEVPRAGAAPADAAESDPAAGVPGDLPGNADVGGTAAGPATVVDATAAPGVEAATDEAGAVQVTPPPETPAGEEATDEAGAVQVTPPETPAVEQTAAKETAAKETAAKETAADAPAEPAGGVAADDTGSGAGGQAESAAGESRAEGER